MVVWCADVALILIPTEVGVSGHDVVWIMGWRDDLVSVALAVGGGWIW